MVETSPQDNTAAIEDLSDSAPEPKAPATPAPTPEPTYEWVTMPVFGLYGIACDLYPQDIEDNEKMKQHVYDLWFFNRDILRTDDSFFVHQEVRKPSNA